MVSSLTPGILVKQLISWGLGLILFFVGKQLNPKNFAAYKWPIFIICSIVIFLPILFNNVSRGSRRWINIGPAQIQPSEVAKPFLMLFLVNTSLPLLHIIPVLIIMAQPDLGSAISTFSLIIPIILYNKKLIKISLIGIIILIASSPLLWRFALHDYQRHRVITFINPTLDELGRGYNVIQSKIAVGSGGLRGKGYKSGTQGQLKFLPEKHTDFMFASIAEELGLLGVTIILLSYFVLLKSLIKKAFNSNHNRALFLFTLGISIQMWVQMFINIGMNIGIMPVTGIPLPLLSVGGSSLMTYMFCLGIIYSS